MLSSKNKLIHNHTCIQNIMKSDIYSQQVYLSINGSKKVYSLLGFLATLSVILTLGGFAAFKGSILLQKSHFETQMASVLRPINYTHPEIIQMNEYGLDIAIQTTIPLIPEVGELIVHNQKMEQVYDDELGYKNRIESLDRIELEQCSLDTFNHTDKEEGAVKGIEWYLCLKNRTQLKMGGSYSADLYEAVLIDLKPCVNGTSNVTCLPQEDIDEIFASNTLLLRVIDYYFDKDNKENPVQSYINDQMFFQIIPEETINQELKIKLSKAIYDDSLNPLSQKIEKEFPQFENIYTSASLRRASENYLRVSLKLNYFSNLYSKTLYSFTDYLSEIGGIFNALYGSGKLVMFLFMDSLLLKTIINYLFTYTNNEFLQNQSTLKQFGDQVNISSKSSILEKISSEASRRSKIALNKFDCCFFGRCSQKNSKEMQRLYQQGRTKLRYDLDILALFRMMQEFSILKHLLLTKNQRVLLKWQKRLTLFQDNNFDENQVKNDKQRSILRLDNPVQKLNEIQKLNYAVLQLQDSGNPLTKTDKILLDGVININYLNPEKNKQKQKVKKIQKKDNHLQVPQIGIIPKNLRTERQKKKNQDESEVLSNSIQRESDEFIKKKHKFAKKKEISQRK